MRDVARVMDLPYAEADTIAKLVPAGPKVTLSSALETEPGEAKFIEILSTQADAWRVSRVTHRRMRPV